MPLGCFQYVRSLAAILWLPINPTPSQPIEVLVVLAMLVKELYKIAGNLASCVLSLATVGAINYLK